MFLGKTIIQLQYSSMETDTSLSYSEILCKTFKFRSDLKLRKCHLGKFPKYYQETLCKCGKFLFLIYL